MLKLSVLVFRVIFEENSTFLGFPSSQRRTHALQLLRHLGTPTYLRRAENEEPEQYGPSKRVGRSVQLNVQIFALFSSLQKF